jgi:hypothetical protein
MNMTLSSLFGVVLAAVGRTPDAGREFDEQTMSAARRRATAAFGGAAGLAGARNVPGTPASSSLSASLGAQGFQAAR